MPHKQLFFPNIGKYRIKILVSPEYSWSYKIKKISWILYFIFFIPLSLDAQTPVYLPLPVNSDNMDENAPMISADGQTLYFNSDKKGGSGWRIYRSKKLTDTSWSAPELIEQINKTDNPYDFFGGPFLSYDNNRMYFTSTKKGGKGMVDVWYADRLGSEWTTAQSMPEPINTPAYDGFASVSADGNSIYFMRNVGGKCYHIYTSHKQADMSWSEPVALPPVINAACEKYPRILADSRTLIWASDREGGLGGYDLYKSVLQDDSSWSTPVNLDFINTPQNEALISVPASGDVLYFSSDARGSLDIYTIPIPENFRQMASILVTGTVVDSLTGNPLGAAITITDAHTQRTVAQLQCNHTDGTYSVVLTTGRTYDFAVSASGYGFASAMFDLDTLANYEQVKKHIALVALQANATFRLTNLLFDTNSAALSPASTAELNRLVVLLTQNKNCTVQIAAHTDDQGQAAYNQTLSLQRAQAVVDYLISKGVNAARLQASGLGQTKPLVPNDSPANRAFNRRVEFTILSM